MSEKLRRATNFYKKGDKEEAANLLSSLVQEDPDNSSAWYGLSLCLDDENKKKYCLEKVIELNPYHPKVEQIHKILGIHQEEIDVQLTTSQNTNYFGYVLVAILILVMIILVSNFGSSGDSTKMTLTPQQEKAIHAVQSQRTFLADDMHYSIGVVFVLLENEGHRTSIDGWYVSSSNDHNSVKFFFYLDGEREFAEWWYYLDGKISSKNNWANTFMGY